MLLASPILVAAVLTVLVNFADRLHLNLQRIAGYCFLFGTPWGWLLDHNWFGNTHVPWVEFLTEGAVILWIPALLYSSSLWLLLRLLGFRSRHDPR
jgi:hypothetical protein